MPGYRWSSLGRLSSGALRPETLLHERSKEIVATIHLQFAQDVWKVCKSILRGQRPSALPSGSEATHNLGI